MKKAITATTVIVAMLAPLATFGSSQKQGPHEPEFRAFYAAFLKAVQANDKEKIADMVEFPVSDWSIEIRHNVTAGSIKDRADFITRYTVFFTNNMRTRLPKAKVQPTDAGWFASWRDGNSESSFDFVYVEGKGFRVGSYSIGPY